MVEVEKTDPLSAGWDVNQYIPWGKQYMDDPQDVKSRSGRRRKQEEEREEEEQGQAGEEKALGGMALPFLQALPRPLSLPVQAEPLPTTSRHCLLTHHPGRSWCPLLI